MYCLGLSNQKIADKANLPKGTIDGLFANAHSDFRYETIRPVLKVLTGGEQDGMPCPDPTENERATYEEKIRQLENEIRWRDDTITRLEQQDASMQTLVTNTNARYTTDKDFMRGEIKRKNRIIAVLASMLVLCLTLIIAAIVIDFFNSEVGYFWIRSMFNPTGGDTENAGETAKMIINALRG